MNTSIEHLPIYKQKELNHLTELLKSCRGVEMVILFGSYARNTWVEDMYVEDGITYEYKSDFDVLVVTKYDDLGNNYKIEEKVDVEVKGRIKTPLGIIFHSIKDFNRCLSDGSYFFSDIKKEGVLLYDSQKYTLQNARVLTPTEAEQKAQEYFENWFKSANMFFLDYETNFERKHLDLDYLKKAAFELHQATERYYTTILLVFTDYRPKEHDLKRLDIRVQNCDKRFDVFPKTTQEEKRLFELLRRAYIDARYKMKEFHITESELRYLAECVHTLKQLTDDLCKERIIAIRNGDKGGNG